MIPWIDIVRLGIGEHEEQDARDAEGPVQNRARAIFVRQIAAMDAEQARRERERRGEHAGRFDIEFRKR